MKNEDKAKMVADQCRPCSPEFYSGFYQGALLTLNAEEKATKQIESNAWDAAIISFAAECGDDMNDEIESGVYIYKNKDAYINRLGDQ